MLLMLIIPPDISPIARTSSYLDLCKLAITVATTPLCSWCAIAMEGRVERLIRGKMKGAWRVSGVGHGSVFCHCFSWNHTLHQSQTNQSSKNNEHLQRFRHTCKVISSWYGAVVANVKSYQRYQRFIINIYILTYLSTYLPRYALGGRSIASSTIILRVSPNYYDYTPWKIQYVWYLVSIIFDLNRYYPYR